MTNKNNFMELLRKILNYEIKRIRRKFPSREQLIRIKGSLERILHSVKRFLIICLFVTEVYLLRNWRELQEFLKSTEVIKLINILLIIIFVYLLSK